MDKFQILGFLFKEIYIHPDEDEKKFNVDDIVFGLEKYGFQEGQNFTRTSIINLLERMKGQNYLKDKTKSEGKNYYSLGSKGIKAYFQNKRGFP